MKVICVAGARPNFVKIAPLIKELKKQGVETLLVHTGQHYDKQMSDSFFTDLDIPQPDVHLGVGSGPHGEQTGRIMIGFEPVVVKEMPDVVIVVGDVNSTIACALVASKLGVKVAHVEAGLRSFDPTMPEEINRMLTDQISDYLFVTEESGLVNLKKEGISDDKVFFVGNIMIDSLVKSRDKILKSKVLKTLGLAKSEYGIITLHRPSNVDDEKNIRYILDMIGILQQKTKIVFPAHPRTRNRFREFHLEDKIGSMKDLIIIPPTGYLDFLHLVGNARYVLTDSGGVQEETTFLGIPCLTLRKTTERPVTVSEGTNTLIELDSEKVSSMVSSILKGAYKKGNIPKLWDGRTAERIVKILIQKDNEKKAPAIG